MKKKTILIPLMAVAACAAVALGGSFAAPVSASEAKTGVGLSEHVLMAKNENWKYVYGAYGRFSNGRRASDCSGLIKSYLWWTGPDTNPNPGLMSVPGSGGGMLSASKSKGTINYSKASSLPNIHGLILAEPGHVGVYVGNDMAVDNREPGVNMKYEAVFARKNIKWKQWFKLAQLNYPTTGWASFNGSNYYYENGQYVVNTTKTIDNTVYTFGADGTVSGTAPTDSAQAQAVADTAAAAPAPAAEPAPTPAAKVPAAEPAPTPAAKVPAAAPAAKAPAAKAPAPAKMSATTYVALSVDSQGAAVKTLQQKLSDLGYYYEAVNNYYDYCVQDAVELFQSAASLPVTGKADEATQTRLYAADAPKNSKIGTLYPGMHSGRVKVLQENLTKLGHFSGETSFFYGDATKAAVQAYQSAAKSEPTGTMDAAAVAALDMAAAKAVEVKVPEATTPAVKAPVAPVISAPAAIAVKAPVEETPEVNSVYRDTLPEAAALGANEQQRPAANGALAFVLVLVCGVLAICAAMFLRRKGILARIAVKADMHSHNRKMK